jgi:hypothetical protein
MAKKQTLTIRLGDYKIGDILSITVYDGEEFSFEVKKETRFGEVEAYFNKSLNKYGIFITKQITD